MTRRTHHHPQVGSPLAGRAALLVLAGLLGAAAVPAIAQTSGTADPSPSEQAKKADETPQVGETITVTARKKEENLQLVPIAVSVETGEALEEKGVADISEMQSAVPNL